mmetsp:Transcript_50750/g.123697  ORF Transcript_50750/g.123697 Transcript_50750/m.123697 type:complete len:201 (-) Transcript_50750:539-1141(-)
MFSFRPSSSPSDGPASSVRRLLDKSSSVSVWFITRLSHSRKQPLSRTPALRRERLRRAVLDRSPMAMCSMLSSWQLNSTGRSMLSTDNVWFMDSAHPSIVSDLCPSSIFESSAVRRDALLHSTSAMANPPVSPTLFPLIIRCRSVVFLLRAAASDFAPSSPMSLKLRSRREIRSSVRRNSARRLQPSSVMRFQERTSAEM